MMIKKITILILILIFPQLSTAAGKAPRDSRKVSEKVQACYKKNPSENEVKSNGEKGPYPNMIKCMTPIAEEGSIRAQKWLARTYSRSADKNDKLSMYWYTKAGEQGDSNAYAMIAGKYEDKGDYENAIKWTTKAYELDEDDAGHLSDLAAIYRKKGDSKTAFDLYAIAVTLKNGNRSKMDSCVALSEMYSKGEGVKKDKIKAYMWGHISANNYYQVATGSTIKQDMESLNLSITEKHLAKNSAKKCKKNGYNDC